MILKSKQNRIDLVSRPGASGVDLGRLGRDDFLGDGKYPGIVEDAQHLHVLHRDLVNRLDV